MSYLKIYDVNISEYENDGYFDINNTIVMIDETAMFAIRDIPTAITVPYGAYLYRVNYEKYKQKTIEETLTATFACSSSGQTVYLDSQSFADNPGYYRFLIKDKVSTVDPAGYYSEVFCINETKTADFTYKLMNSGFIKIYEGDYFEFSQPGYFDNNSILSYRNLLPGFYFDSTLDVDAVLAQINMIKEDSLKFKNLQEYKYQNITPTYSGSDIYFANDYFDKQGIFRYKMTVRPVVGANVVFYSSIFCVEIPPSIEGLTAQFNDASYIQFNDGTFMDFND